MLVLNTEEAEISEDSFVEGRNGDIQFEEEKQHDLKSVDSENFFSLLADSTIDMIPFENFFSAGGSYRSSN